MRMLCAIDYKLLEEYRAGKLENASAVKKAEEEQKKLDEYYEEYDKWDYETLGKYATILQSVE